MLNIKYILEQTCRNTCLYIGCTQCKFDGRCIVITNIADTLDLVQCVEIINSLNYDEDSEVKHRNFESIWYWEASIDCYMIGQLNMRNFKTFCKDQKIYCKIQITTDVVEFSFVTSLEIFWDNIVDYRAFDIEQIKGFDPNEINDSKIYPSITNNVCNRIFKYRMR